MIEVFLGIVLFCAFIIFLPVIVTIAAGLIYIAFWILLAAAVIVVLISVSQNSPEQVTALVDTARNLVG
ncbi:MAG: hypothetical protein DRH90_22745 [Deltaproteobacteria bacterium]|nr:MAG: hypothetical protein DRH90_22745 [Deltaproteobacteria bacterium]